MKMKKYSMKEDKSPRVTSSGSEKKNYQGSKPPIVSPGAKKWSGGNAILGVGNNKKPDGILPNMGVSAKTVNSPRNNSFHGKY